MTPEAVASLAKASEDLERASADINDAMAGTEDWGRDSLRYLQSEITVSRRRIGNVVKALGTTTRVAG